MGERRIKIYQIPWIISVVQVTALFLLSVYWINPAIQYLLFQVYIVTTWLHMGLRLRKQATKHRRVHKARPPPKPDPKSISSKREQQRNRQRWISFVRDQQERDRYERKSLGVEGKHLSSSLTVPEKKQALLQNECWTKIQVLYCPLFVWFMFTLLRDSTCWWTYLAFYIVGYVCIAEFVIGGWASH